MMDFTGEDCYGLYKNSRNAAWHTIIDYEIKELPVSTTSIADKMNAAVIPYSDRLPPPQPGMTGHAEFVKGQWRLFFAPETLASGRARFTLAHEIGHILLGHRLQNGTFHDDLAEEAAANMYAARLLAPACVLWALDLHTPEEISAITGLSIQSAVFRARRLRELRKRDRFLTSPLEQQVYRQFLPFIESIKQKR